MKDTSPTPRIRPIGPSDGELLRAFYAGLSPDSREARFHGAAPGIGETTARFFCGPDHEHREGLVACVPEPGGGCRIVGHLCLEPLADGSVEMAIAVADAWQQHGIGSRLLRDAFAWADSHGVHRLTASVRVGNAAIMALIRAMGRPFELRPSDVGVVDVIILLDGDLPHAA
ncbi:MAG TPA: GNAT family N-acetyltransferase [Candidatus Binatia bacterium]|nr:GNAT family N-acetyltransferase [Candidatus Binatia bacterium]